ncbi:hypothetical protein GUJ93_ZPchr0013g34010 [Zizania palustris]|uniref:Uncharacterized protein n=1 Tax=Zizania palustris TaxID=103762 RepID=A0A8J5X290_ZIZPA|nr:hypothetical protein GUJ93_ZPchr0013g34010 [Zizania palustris]
MATRACGSVSRSLLLFDASAFERANARRWLLLALILDLSAIGTHGTLHSRPRLAPGSVVSFLGISFFILRVSLSSLKGRSLSPPGGVYDVAGGGVILGSFPCPPPRSGDSCRSVAFSGLGALAVASQRPVVDAS